MTTTTRDTLLSVRGLSASADETPILHGIVRAPTDEPDMDPADLVTGETVHEARRLTGLYRDMIKGRQLACEELADLDEAAELATIFRMPARVKCAELALRTLEKLLDQQLEGVRAD